MHVFPPPRLHVFFSLFPTVFVCACMKQRKNLTNPDNLLAYVNVVISEIPAPTTVKTTTHLPTAAPKKKGKYTLYNICNEQGVKT